MTDYLITGAAGFAGQHLTTQLAQQTRSIAGTYYRTTPPFNPSAPDIRWHYTDAADRENTRDLIDHLRPKKIIHLAAASMPSVANKNPRLATETNVTGWINLLDAVAEFTPTARVLLVSSYHVYGQQNPPATGYPESAPTSPTDIYTASRIMAEQSAHAIAKRNNLDIIIARVGNHVGPGQRPGYFVSSLADQIARIELQQREPVIRVGNLNVQRDITDVRDIVRAYTALLKNGQPGQTYNVCTGQPILLRKIVDTLCNLSSVDCRIETDPTLVRENDPPIVFADPTKLRTDTGWFPQIEIEETLQDVLTEARRRHAVNNEFCKTCIPTPAEVA